MDRNNALNNAAQNGHVDVVELLLGDPRVDPAAHDHAAIVFAASRGHLYVIDLLLADGRTDPSALDNLPVFCAAHDGHTAVVQRLLQDARVDPSAHWSSALVAAAAEGHLAIVELLLRDERVDPAALNSGAVRFAAEQGHLAIVKLLMADVRVDPGAFNSEALYRASMGGHADVVEQLLKSPLVDPSCGHDAMLMAAASRGHTAVVDLLLSDPRVRPERDQRGHEALSMAAGTGHADTVDRLLADPRINPAPPGDEGLVLGSAAVGGHVDVVRRLLADPRVDPSASQYGPLGAACAVGRWSVAWILLTDDRTQLLPAVLSMVRSVCGFRAEPSAAAAWAGVISTAALANWAARSSRALVYSPADLSAVQQLTTTATRWGITIHEASSSAQRRLLSQLGVRHRLTSGLDGVFLSPASTLAAAAERCGVPLTGNGAILTQANAHASCLARELGRAMQPRLLHSFGYSALFRAAPYACAAGSLAAANESSGLLWAAAAAAAVMPSLLSEADAARRGFNLLQEAGMGRLASLRAFSYLPPKLLVGAAPLAAFATMRHYDGYGGLPPALRGGRGDEPAFSRSAMAAEVDLSWLPAAITSDEEHQSTLRDVGMRLQSPFALAYMAAATGSWAAGRFATFLATTSRAPGYSPAEAAAVQSLQLAAAERGVAIVHVTASQERPLLKLLRKSMLLRRSPWLDAVFLRPGSALALAVQKELGVAGPVGLPAQTGGRGSIVLPAGARAAALARALGRAAQWRVTEMISLGSFRWSTRLTATMGILCGSFAGNEARSWEVSAAAGVPMLPALVTQAGAALRGYSLMREAGMSRFASLSTFSQLPYGLGMALAPLAGHYAKLRMGGFGDKPEVGSTDS